MQNSTLCRRCWRWFDSCMHTLRLDMSLFDFIPLRACLVVILTVLSFGGHDVRAFSITLRRGLVRGSQHKQRRRHTVALRAAETTASICVIGGGVSGLTAAWTAARELYNTERCKIVLLEASPTLGGRVQSDTVVIDDSGLILDRGFAVFIEEYPYAKELLDYDALGLRRFLPGALIKLDDSSKPLARVADPLRQPQDVWTALVSPVGSLRDKIDVLPLVLHVKSKSIAQLFDEPETDTYTALTQRWGFSSSFVECFFRPFLEGIYLGPLEEQSSRMFHFVFKMFSDGAATLPTGGMQAVAQQLVDKATAAGVDLRTNAVVTRISHTQQKGYVVHCNTGDVRAETVIVATEGPVAKKLLATVDGLQALDEEQEMVERSVGCLYYSFSGEAPVQDPILVLNGMAERGTDEQPVNNVCFPSVVNPSYASPSSSNDKRGLCSVTILQRAMESFAGRDADLDAAVRNQLSTWFPKHQTAILNDWKLERIYRIRHAQPAQLYGPLPANENGGRPCNTYRYATLPDGLFVCGDHVATATLNGALESGVNAGKAAAIKAS